MKSFVIWMSIAYLADAKEIQAPASVLFVDDAAMDSEEIQCATALLQSSKGHRPASTSGGWEAAWRSFRQTVESRETSVEESVNVLRSKLPSLQEDPGLRDLVHQHFESFALCDAQLKSSLDAGNQLNTTYQQWKEVQDTCSSQEKQLASEVAACRDLPCREASHQRLHEKRAECSSIGHAAKAARCLRSDKGGICEAYQTCRKSMSLAFSRAAEALRHSFPKKGLTTARWALEAVRCLEAQTARLGAELAKEELVRALDACEHRASALVEVRPPPALPCEEVKQEEGCDETSSLQDLAGVLDEDLVSGVSFMQEEDSVLLPMHQALASPLATPVCLLLAFFTLAMLLVRCWMTLRGVRPSAPKSVDAWCVSRLETKLSPENEEGWLCAELVVPKKSHCTIFVPDIGRNGGTALVTDKMGQTMFRSSTVEVDGELQISLRRPNGQMLANGQLSGQSSCQIFQGAEPFASIEWEDAQRSWFSKSMPGAFTVRSSSGVVLLRVENVDGALRFSDDFGAVGVAKHEAGILRVEVRSERNTDLGLVTLSALSIRSFSEVTERKPGAF